MSMEMATTGVQQTEIDLQARFCSVIIVGNGKFSTLNSTTLVYILDCKIF